MHSRPARRCQPVLASGAVGAAVLPLLTLALALGVAACGPVSGSSTGAGSRPPSPRPPLTVPTADLAAQLGCPDDTPVAVGERIDLPTGQPAAVVVAHCQSAAGSPPDGVYVVSRRNGATHVTGTLVPAADQVDVSRVVRSGDRVEVTGRGYSGPGVPRCCPDVTVRRSWHLVGDRLVPAG